MFAMMTVGLDISRTFSANFLESSSFHSAGCLDSNPAVWRACCVCLGSTPIPTSSLPIGSAYESLPVVCFFARCRARSTATLNHSISSSSMSYASRIGFPIPGFVIFPSSSTLPDASTTCSKASACDTTLRNCVPRPLPAHAPLIRPGRSRMSTGMNRQPSRHDEFTGLSVNPSSRQTQSVWTRPVPRFGFFVVKG